MTKSPTEKRSALQSPRVGPRRSFARGLVVAVPAAVLLWALVVWLIA